MGYYNKTFRRRIWHIICEAVKAQDILVKMGAINPYSGRGCLWNGGGGGKHCLLMYGKQSLVMCGFCSNNAPYFATLSLKFIFLLLPKIVIILNQILY